MHIHTTTDQVLANESRSLSKLLVSKTFHCLRVSLLHRFPQPPNDGELVRFLLPRSSSRSRLRAIFQWFHLVHLASRLGGLAREFTIVRSILSLLVDAM